MNEPCLSLFILLDRTSKVDMPACHESCGNVHAIQPVQSPGLPPVFSEDRVGKSIVNIGHVHWLQRLSDSAHATTPLSATRPRVSVSAV